MLALKSDPTYDFNYYKDDICSSTIMQNTNITKRSILMTQTIIKCSLTWQDLQWQWLKATQKDSSLWTLVKPTTHLYSHNVHLFKLLTLNTLLNTFKLHKQVSQKSQLHHFLEHSLTGKTNYIICPLTCLTWYYSCCFFLKFFSFI